MAMALAEMYGNEPEQHGGTVIWLRGKDRGPRGRLAESVRRELTRRGFLCAILDEEALRGIAAAEPAQRGVRERTIAGIAASLAAQGLVVVVISDSWRIGRERGRNDFEVDASGANPDQETGELIAAVAARVLT